MDRILSILLLAKVALFASAVTYVGATLPIEGVEQPVPVEDALVQVDEDFPPEDPRLP
ncbi:MAG: hypothetical protein GY913_05360 [Proteobacteria bacterium]|nr:hypothetical protein [Pseudomonadota bacterium]MCP4916330.1 hypothetical protein [Pseudomonadota bacterium]